MEKAESRITQSTVMPISLIITLATALTGGAWWASAVYARVAKAEEHIDVLQDGHNEVVRELRAANETLIEIKTVLKAKER